MLIFVIAVIAVIAVVFIGIKIHKRNRAPSQKQLDNSKIPFGPPDE